MLLLISNAMKGFKGMSETMAHSISGSVAGLSASIHAATQSLASMVGLDQETQSIIKDALRNRRSTGKSDVNIVGRTDTNPESKGEIVGKDGDDNGPLPSDPRSHSGDVHGDGDVSDKEGANAGPKSESGNNVLDGGKGDVSANSGRVDGHLASSGNDVLDTTPSNYDGAQDASNSGNVDNSTVEKYDSNDDTISVSSEGSYQHKEEEPYNNDSDTSSVSSEGSYQPKEEEPYNNDSDTSNVSSEDSYQPKEEELYNNDSDTSSVSSEDSYQPKEEEPYNNDSDTSSVSSDNGDTNSSSGDSSVEDLHSTSTDSEPQSPAVSDVAETPDVGDASDSSLNNATNNNENTGENNNSDIQAEEGKASVVVDPWSGDDNDGKRGKQDINFLEGPQKRRLYMDEHSSVAQKIAGHESAIEVEKESHERSIVKKRGKKDE